MKRTSTLLTFALLGGCAVAGDPSTQATPYDDDFPVSDYDSLFEGAPANSTLPDENKADAHYPAQYAEPRQWDSPVKSQGSRGVCSIFSTVALMEHLYIKEGTVQDPDFSEQYLQWSVKFQVSSFPNSSGSNAYYNLRAISDYGIVREEHDPYETFEWGVAQDPACTGDDRPTRCYTNGEPSEEARNARKWRLPRGRWLNTNSIKAHMTAEKTGVIVGLDFFYQSWNHRLSELPINNEYWREGYVTYPNDEDKEKSLAKRAGHSILLVGWDDDLEVQARDAEGNLVVDGDGNPVMEKGFYLFKNSWGRGSFGVNNAHGDGYGWISMRYVEEYGTAYVSGEPNIDALPETCGDGLDNDDNGATDCDDAACSGTAECQTGANVLTFESAEAVAIPDNDPVGVSTEITVADQVDILGLTVTTNITHTYRGDLRVTLYRDDTAVVLHDRVGGGQDDLVKTFDVEGFDGTSATGTWRLKVEDHAGQDVGTLNGWSLEVLTAAE